jgi:hypothetical protein
MINVNYDAEHNAVVIEFRGNVDAAQAERALSDLDKVLPKGKGGFRLLSDFSAVDVMEPEVEGEIQKTMEFFSARGVSEVFRVLPDPDWDIGFNVMSRARYSKQVKIHTLRSRKEAEALLRGAAAPS